jgi:multiple sugar transport system ATP-binding protein
MAPILDIQNLFKNYGTTEILKNINVSIEPGDFLVLVGPSGCGKSTLLNCIAGLEPITGGNLFIDGQDMTHVSPKDRDIAMVFQSYALYPTMSVAKNITFGMKVRGVDSATQERKLNEVANQLQIEPLLNRRPGTAVRWTTSTRSNGSCIGT